MSALLEIEGLVAGYGRTQVLHQVALEVREREIVALIGANGAGKSTLLNTVMGLVPVAAGDVRLAGKSVRRLSTAGIVRAGLVQVPERRQLFGSMSVEENLRMGAFAVKDRGSIAGLMERQFEQFPILRERRRQLASTLSGGEQQMVAIARAMMAAPRIMLLDEPSLGLAPLFVTRIFEQIKALRASGGTILLVEQNARLALSIADRGYVLESGRIGVAGSAAELLHDPHVQDAYLGGAGSSSRAMEQSIRAMRRAMQAERAAAP
jgi:branched-chain amino acid transport system ATP-binding protein